MDVHRAPAGAVIIVQSIQIRAGDQKRGDPAAVVADPDFCQVAPFAQQKSAPKKVCDL
jgi:hypothetical protein